MTPGCPPTETDPCTIALTILFGVSATIGALIALVVVLGLAAALYDERKGGKWKP